MRQFLPLLLALPLAVGGRYAFGAVLKKVAGEAESRAQQR